MPTMMSARRLDPSQPVVYLDYDGVLHSDEVYWYRRRGVVVKADHDLFAAADIRTADTDWKSC